LANARSRATGRAIIRKLWLGFDEYAQKYWHLEEIWL
jgi:hypothetical protein